MAQYYAVLKKAIGALQPNTSEARRAIYEKARGALVGQLKAIQPPLSTSEISRQRLELEEAIRKTEREALLAVPVPPAPPPPPPEFEEAYDEPVEDEHLPAMAEAQPLYGMEHEPQYDRDLDVDSVGAPPETDWRNPEPDEDQKPLADEIDEALPPVPALRSFDRDRRPDREPVLDWRPTEEDAPLAEDEPEEIPARRGRKAARPAASADEGRRERRSLAPLILSLLLLVVVGGAGYVGWSQRGFIGEVFTAFRGDGGGPEAVATTPDEPKVEGRIGAVPVAADPTVRVVGAQPAPTTPAAPATPTGPETQVTMLSPPPSGLDAAIEALAAAGTAPTTQRAILFEQPAAEGQSIPVNEGTVNWVYMPSGPEGPAVAADVSIPGSSLRFRIFLHKNADATIPASHLIEVVPEVPANFPPGGIDRVLPILMKESLETGGRPLVAVDAKVTDSLYWIAFSNEPADQTNNMRLLGELKWMDVPIVYTNGRRAILTLELGPVGEQVVDQAIIAWAG